MVRGYFAAAAATAVLSVSLVAQDFKRSVAPEVGRLAKLIGTWEGSGTMRKTPGDKSERWTGRCVAAPILGGHFIQQDLEFQTASEDLQSMRVVYGWCGESESYIAVSLASEGASGLSQGAFVDDDKNTLVFSCAHLEDGEPKLVRWIQESDGDDEQRVRIETLVGSRPLATCFEGSYERVEAGSNGGGGSSAMIIDAAMVSKQRLVATSIDPLRFLVGSWTVNGSVMLDPEKQTLVRIIGTESVMPILGGTVLRGQLVAHGSRDVADSLERHAYFVWNPAVKCYDYFWMTSCGHMGRSSCAPADDDKFAMASAGTSHRKPFTEHTILTKHSRQGKVHKLEIESSTRCGAMRPVAGGALTLERNDQ